MAESLFHVHCGRDWAVRCLLGGSLVLGCVMPDPQFRESSPESSSAGSSVTGAHGEGSSTQAEHTDERGTGGRDAGVEAESGSSGISETTETTVTASGLADGEVGAMETTRAEDGEVGGTDDTGEETTGPVETSVGDGPTGDGAEAETSTGTEGESESGSDTETDMSGDTGSETGTNGGTLAPISLENPGRNFIAPGIAVRLDFDHSALVADGAAVDGRDLRVFRLLQGNFVEVDRMLAHGSAWNRPDTKIWFRSEIPLNINENSDDDYWLNWGGEQGAPLKSDPRAIFAHYDDFSESRFASNGEGDWRLQIVGGRLIIAANAPVGELSWVQISYPEFEFQDQGIIVEAYARTSLPGASAFCGRSSMLEVLDHERNQIRAALAVQSNELKLGTSSGQGTVFYPNGNLDGPGGDGNWHVYGLRWFLSDIEGRLGGETFDQIASDPQWSTPDHRPVYPRVLFEIGGGLCNLSLAGEIEIDWLRVRRSVHDHPRVSFP